MSMTTARSVAHLECQIICEFMIIPDMTKLKNLLAPIPQRPRNAVKRLKMLVNAAARSQSSNTSSCRRSPSGGLADGHPEQTHKRPRTPQRSTHKARQRSNTLPVTGAPATGTNTSSATSSLYSPLHVQASTHDPKLLK